MSGTVTVQGVVTPDGTLELAERLSIPAGKVRVTVVPATDFSCDDPFWQRMQVIWNAQNSRGHVARSEEEVERERRVLREEWDNRMREIDQTRAEAKRLRRSEGPEP
jgi:hypothetical protein